MHERGDQLAFDFDRCYSSEHQKRKLYAVKQAMYHCHISEQHTIVSAQVEYLSI